MPEGIRPVVLRGHAMVGAAPVEYAPGSVVTYDEVAGSFLTREGRRPVSTLSHILVDSVESVAGGRELWAIPRARRGSSATGTPRPWTSRAAGRRR